MVRFFKKGGLALVALSVVMMLGACQKTEQEHRETVYVFGTLVEFIIRDVDEKVARAAVSRLERDFHQMHENWHAWKGGELVALNQAIATGKSFEVSDFLLPMLKEGQRFYRLSNGLFNPAIGKLIETWGFHSDELPKGSLPDFAEIARIAKLNPNMDDLEFDGHVVSSKNPLVQMDFGGFGKGAALDIAVSRLRELGIRNAVINAGGDINTLGDHGDRPWRMGIRHPVKWGVLASVDLRKDEVLYTSGNYERFREVDGIKYAHIIDPSNGMPVRHIVSASVIHYNGALADAAATALTVAGPDHWKEIADKMGIKFALLVDENGTLYLTRDMLPRIVLPEGDKPKLVVVD